MRWLERLAPLQLDILHVKGTDNVAADMLSRVSRDAGASQTDLSRHPVDDAHNFAELSRWLKVVAPHLDDFAVVVEAATSALRQGLTVRNFGCKKCGATHCDVGNMAV